MKEQLLQGVRVLDLTRVLAGPYAGVLLASMGADVIKVENPNGGDDSRHMGPFVGEEGEKQSAYYINFNHSKRGITLNLKEEEGKKIFLELVKQADILLENYRPGTMEKLGLGYDVLKEVNPELIYGCVSGFGHTGPDSKRAGYDIIGQAMGGLMSTTGWPGGEPTRTGTPMGDVLGGLNLTIGVLAALYRKDKTGHGEKVDIALVDSVISSMANISMIYLSTGRVPERIGNRYESTYPYDSFAVKDGSVIIGAGNDKLYGLLCQVMGREDLATDPRYLHIKDRVENHAALKEDIESWSKTCTGKEVVDRLTAVGVPSCPIHSVEDLLTHPQIAHRNMFVELDQTNFGPLKITNCPQHFAETYAGPSKAAPLLGEDNDEVYGELLGMSHEDIEALHARHIL